MLNIPIWPHGQRAQIGEEHFDVRRLVGDVWGFFIFPGAAVFL